MLVNSNAKVFEKPSSNLYTAVLADIVDLGPVYNKKYDKTNPMVRLVWILNAKDKEGNFFRVMRQVTASMGEKAHLFGIVKDITGSTPALPYEIENLLGKNSRLVVSLETAPNGNKYANVKAIMSVEPGAEYFPVPKDFVRSKDRQTQQAAQAAAATSQAPAPATQQAQPNQAAAVHTPAPPPPAQADEEDIPF